MKYKPKRILALILALAMMMSLMVVGVSARDVEEDTEDAAVTETADAEEEARFDIDTVEAVSNYEKTEVPDVNAEIGGVTAGADADSAGLEAVDGEDYDGAVVGNGVLVEQVDRAEVDVDLTRYAISDDGDGESDYALEELEPIDYAQDEMLRVMIVLEGDSVVESDPDADVLSTYAANKMSALEKEQAAVISAIEKDVLDGEELNVEYQFDWIINAISAEVPYGTISEIEELGNVEAVYIEEMYYPVETEETDSGDYDLMLSSSGEMIGREEAWAAGYDGSGMKVAVIDTGLDTSHVNFQALPEEALRDSSADEEFIASVLPNLNAYERYGDTLTASKLYYSTKVPYGFNYIDENLVVNHDNDSEGDHGTHVSGIIAANDVNDVKGVAYNAQIYVMKVFGYLGGAYDSDIIAAIEDAMMLDADAINMSLGATAGFTRDTDEVLNLVYDSVAQTDVIMAVAAGNEYTLGYGNLYGYNAMQTDNPDNGVVSEPASYTSSLSVASVENAGLTSYYVEVDGQKLGYTEGSYGNNQGMVFYFGTTQEYVMIPGWGETSDYEGLDVAGKVAVVSRGGGVTFAEKHEAAEAAGAIAVLVYNNESGTIGADLSESNGTIPFATISRGSGAVLQAAYDAALEAGEPAEIYLSDHVELINNDSAYEMNSFSSWGTTADLRLEPDITAPGGDIYSTTNHDTYDVYSGTSMATPQVAGMSALVKQYLVETYPDMADTEYRAMLTELLMTTASPLLYDDETYYSPREQGNGLANAYDAITSTAYLQVDGTIEPQEELGDDPEKTGSYTYSFDVVNFGDTDLYYDIATSIQTENCDYGEDGNLYMDSTPINLDGTTSASGSAVVMTYDYDENAAANSHDAWLLYQKAGEEVDWSVEPVFRYDLTGDDGVMTNDAQAYLDALTGLNEDVNLSAQVVEVKAGTTESVTISVQVADSGKVWMDTYYPNGIYVEGFTVLTAKNGGVNLSIPYLAFYGDWSVAPMLDGGYYWMEDDERDEKASQYYNVIYSNYGSSTYGFLPGVNPYIDEIYEPENNSISPNGDGYVDGITDIYVTLLRGAKTLTFTFEDEETGELYNEVTIDYARKAFYYSGYGVCTPNFYASYGDPWYGTDADGNTLPDGTKVKLTIHAELDWDDYDSSVNLSDTWVETITIDTQAPELKLDDEDTMPSIEYVYDDEGNIVQQLLTLTYRDDVNVSAVNFVNRGMFILGQYLVDHSAKDEDGWITETYDVTGLGNTFYLVLGDYAINESTYRFTTIDNNPIMDPDLLYGYRVADEDYYNDYVYGWLSVDPTTGESAVLDSEYYMDYAITSATYVNGYVFAAAADNQLYTLIPGLWDEWTWVADLEYQYRTMTYDPANACLWAYSSNNVSQLIKIDLGPALDITVVGQTSETWTAIASDDSGNLYGITTDGMLCLIDQKTGEAASVVRDLSTDIANYLGLTSSSPIFQYGQSMTYNAADGCFYWAAYTSNSGRFGGLVRIKIAEGSGSATVEVVDTIEGNAEVLGLLKLENRGNLVIPEEYEITDIYLKEETVTMLAGGSTSLNYLVTPWYADSSLLNWSSSDTTVARVSSEGVVTSVSEGIATITVSDPTGIVSAVCTVKVIEPDATLVGFANYFYSYTIDQQWFSFTASDVAHYDVLSDYLPWYLLAAEYADGYLYGFDWSGDFVRMDPANNYETVLIGSLPIIPAATDDPYRNRMYVYDMSYDWSTGTMYALISLEDLENDIDPMYLYTIDLLNGDLEQICELTDEHGAWASCITIDDNSVVYMVTGNALLSTYDLKTGETHDIGMLGVTPNTGYASMAYDHETGYIYWSDPYAIYFIDKATGAAYRLGRLEGSYPAVTIGLYVVNDEEYLPERESVAVSSVSVDSDKVLLMEGTSSALPLTIHPINASDRNLDWTIEDNSIAIIKDGYAYGLKAGTTTAVGIIATSGGTKTVTLTIEVAPATDTIQAWVYHDLWSEEYGYWDTFSANDLSDERKEYATYVSLLAGDYYDGKIYAYGGSNELMIIDADSWKVEQTIPWEESWDLCDLTFDYTTGTFYGVTTAARSYNYSENPGALYMIDFETGETYKIADYSTTIWGLACSADGTLYGYHSDGSLVTIDKLTGEETLVGYTDYNMNQPGTMAFDYNTGNLFVTPCYYEWMSSDFKTCADLLLVDPTDATTFRLGKLGLAGKVVTMLYTVPTTFDDTVPADYTPTGIWLSSTKENMEVGETLQLSAVVAPISVTGTYANEAITFSSSDPSVATVDQNGLVTAVSGGKATITASWNGLSSSCSILILDDDTFTFYVMSPDKYETAPLTSPDNKSSAVSYPSALPTLQDTVYSEAEELFYGIDESGYLWKYSLDGSTVEQIGTKSILKSSYEILRDYDDPTNSMHQEFLENGDPDGTAILTDLTYNTFDEHVYMMVEIDWDEPGYSYYWWLYFIFQIDPTTGDVILCGQSSDVITSDIAYSFTFVEEDYYYCYCGTAWIMGEKMTLDTVYNGNDSNTSIVCYDYDVFQNSAATKPDMVYMEDLDAVYLIGYDSAHRTGMGIYKFDMHTYHLSFECKVNFSTSYISLVVM